MGLPRGTEEGGGPLDVGGLWINEGYVSRGMRGGGRIRRL